MKSVRSIVNVTPLLAGKCAVVQRHQRDTSCKKQLKPISGFMIPCQNHSCNMNMARMCDRMILTYIVGRASSCK